MTERGRISFSDPEYEAEGVRFVTIKSEALGGRADVTVYVPPGDDGAAEWPLVVLLHGVYGSHWNWAFMGGAHRTAQSMIADGEITPIVLAMPSDGLWGDGSSYVPHHDADYEQWIVEDLIDALLDEVAALGESSPVYISGLSMGGYGALRLGAKYPERFQAISAHSSVPLFEQMEQVLQRDGASYDVSAGEDGSVFFWFLENRDRLPPVRFDCGVEDGLIEGNRQLHAALDEHGVPHIYEEFEGGHTWDYWGLHLRDTLRFFEKIRRQGARMQAGVHITAEAEGNCHGSR